MKKITFFFLLLCCFSVFAQDSNFLDQNAVDSTFLQDQNIVDFNSVQQGIGKTVSNPSTSILSFLQPTWNGFWGAMAGAVHWFWNGFKFILWALANFLASIVHLSPGPILLMFTGSMGLVIFFLVKSWWGSWSQGISFLLMVACIIVVIIGIALAATDYFLK